MKYTCNVCTDNAKPCSYEQTQEKGRVCGSLAPSLCPWTTKRTAEWKRADGKYQYQEIAKRGGGG